MNFAQQKDEPSTVPLLSQMHDERHSRERMTRQSSPQPKRQLTYIFYFPITSPPGSDSPNPRHHTHQVTKRCCHSHKNPDCSTSDLEDKTPEPFNLLFTVLAPAYCLDTLPIHAFRTFARTPEEVDRPTTEREADR